MATKKKEEVSWEEEAAQGMEAVRQQDMGFPFVSIMENNSPQVKKSNPNYVPGLEEGDIVLQTTHEKLGDSVQPMIVVPCFMRTIWSEFIPREKGGGFVTSYLDNKILEQCEFLEVDGKRKCIHRVTGNEIVETAYWFCTLVKNSGCEKIIITIASARLKDSRNF